VLQVHHEGARSSSQFFGPASLHSPGLAKKSFKTEAQSGVVEGLTFPNCKNRPIALHELATNPLVASNVLIELLRPEFYARLRRVREFAPRMTVPKAAVNKHCCFKPRENDIWCSGQIAPVKSKPVPHPMKGPTDVQFRNRVSLAYAGHHGAALGIYCGRFSHLASALLRICTAASVGALRRVGSFPRLLHESNAPHSGRERSSSYSEDRQ